MGHLHMLSKILVVVSFLGLVVGTSLFYSTSKMIMAGDRIMQNYPPGYLGLTMSNKNWLLLLALAVVGGCLAYIVYAFVKRKGRFTR